MTDITSTSIVGRRGDYSAPPGSLDWSIALRDDIALLLRRHDFDADRLQTLLNSARENRAWAVLPSPEKTPFASFEEFCAARKPFGLGYDPKDIDAIIAERKDAAKLAREAKPLNCNGGDRKSVLVTNTEAPKKQGEDSAYLTARIARDNPELLERMKQGEFKSVRAAAIEAGIVKPRLSVPSDVDGAARALKRHFTPEQLSQLKGVL